MSAQVQLTPDAAVLHWEAALTAETDASFCAQIRELIDAARPLLVLALRAVPFIDSVGLERLLWTRDACREQGIHLRLAELSPDCRQILTMTRLDHELHCEPRLEDAVRGVA